MHLDTLYRSSLSSGHLCLIRTSWLTIVYPHARVVIYSHLTVAPRGTVYPLYHALLTIASLWLLIFRHYISLCCCSSSATRCNYEIAILPHLYSTMRCNSLLTSLSLKLDSCRLTRCLRILLSGRRSDWRMTTFTIRQTDKRHRLSWPRFRAIRIYIVIPRPFLKTSPGRRFLLLLWIYMLTNHG